MLENPELLREMVARSGAHGTNEESEESVEHLCAKCDNYSKEWGPVADDIWAHQKHYRKSYENYAKENIESAEKRNFLMLRNPRRKRTEAHNCLGGK